MSCNIGSRDKNKQREQEVFDNLLTEIKLYLQLGDRESLQYLLQGEDDQKIKMIREKLGKKQLKMFEQVVQKIMKDNQQQEGQKRLVNNNNKENVKAMLSVDKQQSEDQVFDNFQRQYKVTGIVYGDNYSYPFLSLLQKISLIYFYKSPSNPFPQPSLKMLHSLIQTLFTYVFDLKVKQSYQSRRGRQKKSMNNFLKQFLFFVFEKQYQKFTAFHRTLKTIKSSIKKDQITEEDLNLNKHTSHNSHHSLVYTENLQQLEYFEKISQSIKSDIEFKEYTKIKSLNFLYFGEKRLRELIDPTGKFLTENVQKEIIQLLSFVLCRFVRKVILGCVRDKLNGKLGKLLEGQIIQAVDVKLVGNQLIDKYHKRVEDYLKLDQPLQDAAKRTFIRQFYQHQYENFIPKNIILHAQSIIEKQQRHFLTLPQTIWNHNKQYHTLWLQRMAAEEYIRQEGQGTSIKREKGRNNDYAKFITNHLKQFQENPSLLWINYFTHVNTIPSQTSPSTANTKQQLNNNSNETGLKTRKKIKLESLAG